MAKKAATKGKKQPNIVQKLATKATASRRSLFVTGLIGVLLFSSVGYYVVNRSRAAISPATVCGSGFQQYDGGHYLSLTNSTITGPSKIYLSVNYSTKVACIVVMSTGSTYGVSKPMKASVAVVRASDGAVVKAGGNDSGNFSYYAGPVKVNYSGYANPNFEIKQYGYQYSGGKAYSANFYLNARGL